MPNEKKYETKQKKLCKGFNYKRNYFMQSNAKQVKKCLEKMEKEKKIFFQIRFVILYKE